jgi:hypothetical protein
MTVDQDLARAIDHPLDGPKGLRLTYADDYAVIWRELPIGRIMRAPGHPSHIPQWRWTCNFYGKPGGGSGSGEDLDASASSRRHGRHSGRG